MITEKELNEFFVGKLMLAPYKDKEGFSYFGKYIILNVAYDGSFYIEMKCYNIERNRIEILGWHKDNLYSLFKDGYWDTPNGTGTYTLS